MKTTLISIFIGITLLYSCNKANNNFINKHSKTIKFKKESFNSYNTLKFDNITDFSGIATKIIPVDSLLIINTTGRNKYSIQILSTSGLVKNYALPIGRGPGEIFSSFQIQKFKERFLSYEPETNTTRIYHIDSILFKSRINPLKEYKLGAESLDNIAILNDSTFIVTGYSYSNKKITFFNHNSKIIGEIGEFPFKLNSFKNNNKIFIKNKYDALICVKPDQSKFVLAYKITDAIEIYNNKGNQLFLFQGPDNFSPKLGNRGNFTKETRIAYIGMQCTNKYIFLLYSGKRINEPYPNCGSYIFIINWNGQLIKNYELADRFHAFGIDDVNNKIYGVSEKTGKLIVTTYNFKSR